MKIIRLLLKNSGKNFFLAAISSFISGVGGASIIAVINYAIAQRLGRAEIANLDNLPSWLVWLFISLCVVLGVFRFISWVLITRLSQGIIYDLRLEVTRRILNCPLQHLEVIGAPKLLATLTGDINAIA